MLPVRINASGKALTVTELLEQKKNMHINTFQYMVGELGRELKSIEQDDRKEKTNESSDTESDEEPVFIESEEKMQIFLDQLVKKCEAVLEKHQAIDAKEYTRDATYRELVSEMLETKDSALCSLRLILEDDTVRMDHVLTLSLVDGRRLYLGYLERLVNYYFDEDPRKKQAAKQICKAMGILRKKVDELDVDGMTRLMVAAADGEGIKTVRMLVAAKAMVNAKDTKRGYTALCLAAESGHPETVEILLELKADVNVRADGHMPLTIAASQGHEDVITALVKGKANVNAKESDGRSALHIAVELGFVDAVAALTRRKADLNLRCNNGETPLAIAERDARSSPPRWGVRSKEVAMLLHKSAGKTKSSDKTKSSGKTESSGKTKSSGKNRRKRSSESSSGSSSESNSESN